MHLRVGLGVQTQVQVLSGEQSSRAGLQIDRGHAGWILWQFQGSAQVEGIAHFLARDVADP